MISSFLECTWVSFKCCSKVIIIGVFYRPPNMNNGFSSEFNRILCEICTRFPNCTLLIFGDFNFPSINWFTQSVTASETEANMFLQSCLDFSLSQLITNPTRRTSSTANIIDLILTNNPDICSDIIHLDGISDHDVITGRITGSFNEKKTTVKQIRCYNRANYEKINSEFEIFSTQFINQYLLRTVQQNWDLFKSTFNKLIDDFVPLMTIRCSSSAPWFTQKLRRANNKKKRFYRQAVKNGVLSAWEKYKKCDKDYQSLLKSTRRHFFNHDLSSLLTNNPRKFWRIINPGFQPDILLSDSDGVIIKEYECAQVFNDAFSSVFTKEDISAFPDLDIIQDICMPEIVINETGILALLNNLKITNSSDHLGFNNKLLKNTSQSISAVLSCLFSQSLSHGLIPNDWRIAK